jgi:hypothetical protein
MSIYSTTTESNINKPILNDELNYQKLQKFNKFYLTNNNFSCKDKSKIAPTTKVDNLFIMDIPLTPRTTTLAKTNIKKTHSRNYSTHKTLTKYKTYNNYNRMKKMFNPDILEGQYISKPKKKKIKNCRIEMPKYNTFLASKIKGKSLGIKIANCITGNLSKFIIPDNYNKSFINKSITNLRVREKIKYKKNDEFRGSKLLAEKRRKKAMANVFNQFKQKLNYDKRENLYEYNKFMNSLKINLNLAKYRNSNNEFVYE